MSNGRVLVTLSGPSCVGKGPLEKAVQRIHPGLLSCRPVLCHSRQPRPGEVHGRDYYFLPASAIKSLAAAPDIVVAKVRGDWQALDIGHVADLVGGNDLVFAEVFHTFLDPLRAAASAAGVELRSVFLLPTEPSASDAHIVRTMRTKLRNRGLDSPKKVAERACEAPNEMRSAIHATHRLINRAGEDDTAEWGDLGTRGDKKRKRKIRGVKDLGDRAQWLVETFIGIAQRGTPDPGAYRFR